MKRGVNDMEVEHINDDTVRVYIRSEDLAERGFTFVDLLDGHKEIENFFYSILEEVDVDNQFKGSEAVTFQVIPKGDGLELYISKNMTMEKFSELPFLQELDLQQTNDFDVESVDEDDIFEVDEKTEHFDEQKDGMPRFLEWMNQVTGGKINQQSTEESQETPKHLPTSAPNKKAKKLQYVFMFEDFEDIIEVSSKVNAVGYNSSIYQFGGLYALAIHYTDEYSDREFIDTKNAVFREFGVLTPLTQDVLEEHGHVIMDDHAITQIKRIFNT